MIVADAGGILAYVDQDETDHDAVVDVVSRASEELVVSPFVVADVDFMVMKRFGVDKEAEFLEDLAIGRWTLAPWGNEDMRAALTIVRKYGDLKLGVADASNVVLAHRYDTNRILTLDERHFRHVTTMNGDAFTLLPADAASGESNR